MLGPKFFLPLAVFLVSHAPTAEGFGTPRKADGIDAPRLSKLTVTHSRLRLPKTGNAATDDRISGKWYSAVSCPAWSGRYIFHISRLADGALRGSSIGVSFGAKGHSSEITSGTISSGAFEFIERSDKGFIASYQGSIGPDGSALSGTYKNTRSGLPCHFAMKRYPK